MSGVPVTPTCPKCQTVNPPGMNFCKMCGASLRTAAPAPLPSPATVARPGGFVPLPSTAPGVGAAPQAHPRTCSSCGQSTPPGYSFCQHCGARLASPAEAVAPTLAANDARHVAALVQRPMPAPAPAPMPVPSPWGAPAQAAIPDASGGGAAAGLIGGARPSPQPVPLGAAPSPRPVAGLGRLIAVNRSGQDGEVYPLHHEVVDIGRSDGALLFGGDRYLAPRHARLERRGGHVIIRPLDAINGVYLRLHETVVLDNGDQFLLGKEVLRFEAVDPVEKDPTPAVQHGVHIFGSPLRAPWGRLRQMTVAGTTRDVYYCNRTDVVIGREEGDLRYGDDEFMSRRHAMISFREGRVQLADLGSSNGTFLRLRGDRELRPGDLFRVGDQLLRYEPT